MPHLLSSDDTLVSNRELTGVRRVRLVNSLRSHTNPSRGDPIRKQPHLQLHDCKRFVIFNTKSTTVKETWKLLKTLLDEGAFKSIVRLKRITGPRRLPRIDMWVKNDLAAHIARAITARSRLCNLDIVTAFGHLYRKDQSRRPIASWRIVPWQAFQDRKPGIREIEKSPRKSFNSIMTLNVNGLHTKKVEVMNAMDKHRVAIACLQETLVSNKAYPPAVEGYASYAQPWEDGFRGLAIMVDRRCSSYEVPHTLGRGLIHVRVAGVKGIDGPINVFGLYLPSGGNYRSTRTQFIKNALNLASHQLDKPNGSKVLLMGDWNTTPDRMDKLVANADQRINRMRPRGSNLTRFSEKTGKAKSIDHILVSTEMQNHMRAPRVIRRIALSDHRPVISTIRHSSTGPQVDQKPTYRYDSGMIRKYSEKLVNHNRWDILANLNDTETVNESVESFNTTFTQVTEEMGIRLECGDKGIRFPRRLKELLRRKKRYDKEWTVLHTTQKPIPDILIVKRMRAKASYRKARNEWMTKQRKEFYERVAADAIAGDTKNVWRRLTSTVGNKIHKNSKVRTTAFNPVFNEETKELITDLPGVVNAHADHYERLATFNEDGHRDEWEKWMQLEPADMHDELEGINEPLRFDEVLMAIRRMNRNTATGVDEIHINVLKALVPEESWLEFLMLNPGFTRPDWSRKDLKASELPTEPRTKFGKALFRVLNAAWEKEELPDSWKRVDIVSLLKPGSKPEAVDGYRGISLISVTEKVLLQVMTERLYTAVERAKLLSCEQAGFRRREEAIAQVITVADIVRRRRLAGRSTIGIFIDFKKAYDRVPHGALMHVLAKNGVRGKFLQMVNHIYGNSNMAVRIDGATSRVFQMYRGVRQGCPLSPLLFLLFIESILQESVPDGVMIPGLANQKSKGTMYADDVLCLVETTQQAQQVIWNLDRWCKKWGMELGINKCGVMLWPWGPNAPTITNEKFPTTDGEIPVVTEYKYLGVWLDSSLGDHRSGTSKWGPSLELENSKRRVAEGLKAVHALRPLLTDRLCPLA